MPLIILGLLVVIGIVLYALVRYGQSDDEDKRPVRERYPFAFPQKRKHDANYTVIDDDEEDDGPSGESNGHTLLFPDDAENEKRKRNITE